MNNKDIIKLLVGARKEKRLSQEQLAQLIGTKRENICRIESGKQNISVETIHRISSALDLSVTFGIEENNNDVYVLKLYDEELLSFRLYREKLETIKAEIININKNKKHLFPLDLKLNNEGIIKWLERRVIPKNRYYVEEILASLNLKRNDIKGIIDVCKGLSLNDAYWITKSDFVGSYDNYNLYENHFDKALSLIAYTGVYSGHKGFTTSPELTTNGMLPKAWRYLDNDGIYLYKGGSTIGSNAGREPYMEYYAYQIAKAMGIDAIEYDLVKWKGILASKCKLFTSKDISYIPIGRLVESGDLKDIIKYYDQLGDKYSRHIRDMLVFDALIMNEDRYFGNFGLLKDNHSGKIIAPAPIFDNGLSLLCYIGKNKYYYEEMKKYSESRISAYNIDFDEIVKEVIGTRQKRQLRKIINFRFERHDKYNLNEEFLNNLEKIINERINRFLKL